MQYFVSIDYGQSWTAINSGNMKSVQRFALQQPGVTSDTVAYIGTLNPSSKAIDIIRKGVMVNCRRTWRDARLSLPNVK